MTSADSNLIVLGVRFFAEADVKKKKNKMQFVELSSSALALTPSEVLDL